MGVLKVPLQAPSLVGLILAIVMLCSSCQLPFFGQRPKQMTLTYTWTGLSQYTQNEQYQFSLGKDGKYIIQAQVRRVPFDAEKPEFKSVYQKSIATKPIDALLETLSKTEWKQTKCPQEQHTHENDYPSFVLHTDLPDMKQVFSTSNTVNQVPWNKRDSENRLSFSTQPKIGLAFQNLRQACQK